MSRSSYLIISIQLRDFVLGTENFHSPSIDCVQSSIQISLNRSRCEGSRTVLTHCPKLVHLHKTKSKVALAQYLNTNAIPFSSDGFSNFTPSQNLNLVFFSKYKAIKYADFQVFPKINVTLNRILHQSCHLIPQSSYFHLRPYLNHSQVIAVMKSHNTFARLPTFK